MTLEILIYEETILTTRYTFRDQNDY